MEKMFYSLYLAFGDIRTAGDADDVQSKMLWEFGIEMLIAVGIIFGVNF